MGANLNDVMRNELTETMMMNIDMRLMHERMKQDAVYVQMCQENFNGECSSGKGRKALVAFMLKPWFPKTHRSIAALYPLRLKTGRPCLKARQVASVAITALLFRRPTPQHGNAGKYGRVQGSAASYRLPRGDD